MVKAQQADLGAGIVQNARLRLVGLHRGNVDDGPTLGDVLGRRLCYAEVGLQATQHAVNHMFQAEAAQTIVPPLGGMLSCPVHVLMEWVCRSTTCSQSSAQSGPPLRMTPP